MAFSLFCHGWDKNHYICSIIQKQSHASFRTIHKNIIGTDRFLSCRCLWSSRGKGYFVLPQSDSQHRGECQTGIHHAYPHLICPPQQHRRPASLQRICPSAILLCILSRKQIRQALPGHISGYWTRKLYVFLS